MKNWQQILNYNDFDIAVDGVIGPKTLNATKVYLYSELNKRKWVLPETGLVYFRLDKTLTNTFDDVVALIINKSVVGVYPCSTTAGDFYIFNPITSGGITGTAIACEQQVLASHKFITSANWKSLWLGGPYFQQGRPLSIYRDGNKDRVTDRQIVTTGLYGINLHRGGLGNIIYNWSAGCMVTPDKYWFDIIKNFKNGSLYDFTLIEC